MIILSLPPYIPNKPTPASRHRSVGRKPPLRRPKNNSPVPRLASLPSTTWSGGGRHHAVPIVSSIGRTFCRVAVRFTFLLFPSPGPRVGGGRGQAALQNQVAQINNLLLPSLAAAWPYAREDVSYVSDILWTQSCRRREDCMNKEAKWVSNGVGGIGRFPFFFATKKS